MLNVFKQGFDRIHSAKKEIFCAMMYAHMPIIRDILHGAASRGASLKELCIALDISAEELNDSGKTVRFEQAYRAWEAALAQTGDQLLGLHLGETSTPSILGLIGHLMQSSPDLITAYQQVTKHAVLATDMFTYLITVRERRTILTYKPSQPWLRLSPVSARQAVEQAMAGTLNVFRLLSGRKIIPVETTFTFKKPGNVYEYERIFGTHAFGKQQNALVFKTDDLLLPVVSYDKSLFALFDKLVEEKHRTSQSNTSLSDHVRKVLIENFKGSIVPAEVVAASLSMGLRTLQRKLHEEGTSFREMSASVRKELATQLLQKPGARVNDVARMLGYSEASALRKALKG